MSMCGSEGIGPPRWQTTAPRSNRAALSSRAVTNWLLPEASTSTCPPGTTPRPRTVNGSRARPPSSMSIPSARSPISMGPIGRSRARGSPSNVTSAEPRAATGGTNRMTVPASPQSTATSPDAEPGVTVTSPGLRGVMRAPRPASAAVIKVRSRAPTGSPPMWDGASANDARTSARLAKDLEPGTVTRAATGPAATGASQGSVSNGGAPCSEGIARATAGRGAGAAAAKLGTP